MKSGLVGFLSQIFMLPLTVVTIVVLVITIVGIPFLLLLPFVALALALCVVALVGFKAVAQRLGGMALTRFGGPSGAYFATVLGVPADSRPGAAWQAGGVRRHAVVVRRDAALGHRVPRRVRRMDGRVRRGSVPGLRHQPTLGAAAVAVAQGC